MIWNGIRRPAIPNPDKAIIVRKSLRPASRTLFRNTTLSIHRHITRSRKQTMVVLHPVHLFRWLSADQPVHRPRRHHIIVRLQLPRQASAVRHQPLHRHIIVRHRPQRQASIVQHQPLHQLTIARHRLERHLIRNQLMRRLIRNQLTRHLIHNQLIRLSFLNRLALLSIRQ